MLLPHAPSSVAVARQHLCAQLLASDVLKSTVDDAAVIVSELLSNALRHARPLASGQVRVAWNRQGDVVEVSVSDGGSSTEPRRGRPTLSSLGGRGLGIVESLADCWGIRHEEEGSGGAISRVTTVWALLQVDSPTASTGQIASGAPQADVAGHPTANLLHDSR